MVTPKNRTERPKTSRVPRLFLAMMLIYACLTGIFLPPGDRGPVSQFAVRMAQEWQGTIAHTHLMP